MTKILLVNLTGQMAGAEQSLLLIARHLRTRFAFTLACPKPSPLADRFEQLGVATMTLPQLPKHKFLSPMGLCYWACVSLVVLRIIMNCRPDMVHANTFAALACTAIPARLTAKPIIVHARDFQRYRWISRLAGLFCSQIIAVSCAVRAYLIADGVQTDKITVIYNGVDPPGDGEYRHRGQPFTFAHIGQFVPWKNQTLFLYAAARFHRQNPRARFLLIGDDLFGRDSRYKKNILATIKRLNLTEQIEWLGWQSDMSRLWPRISCLVHTAAAEPFGRVIIESLANAVPVIAVNRQGPAEILRRCPAALLVEPDHLDQLTDAMLQIARRPEPLARSAADRIAQTFSAEKTASRIATLYHSILKGSSHACRHHLSYV